MRSALSLLSILRLRAWLLLMLLAALLLGLGLLPAATTQLAGYVGMPHSATVVVGSQRAQVAPDEYQDVDAGAGDDPVLVLALLVASLWAAVPARLFRSLPVLLTARASSLSLPPLRAPPSV